MVPGAHVFLVLLSVHRWASVRLFSVGCSRCVGWCRGTLGC